MIAGHGQIWTLRYCVTIYVGSALTWPEPYTNNWGSGKLPPALRDTGSMSPDLDHGCDGYAPDSLGQWNTASTTGGGSATPPGRD